MLISLNWLKEYIDITVPVDELSETLTMLGLEIEAISRPGDEISNVVTGKILSIEPHPNAEKLVVCKTDVGEQEPLQIICGAKNMKEGDVVPTAKIGARLAGGFEITKRKMRGIESYGMMCAADELGLGNDHSGLLIMDPTLPVGIDVKPLLGLDDVIFEIEVTPNRNDWSSMLGVARELSAYYGIPFKVPDIKLTESGGDISSFTSITIEEPALCPRYAGRILRGVKVGPSPQWLSQKLIAAGQRPINNIVDITNFVLLETGHPLHAFDYDRLKENRIIVRQARKGEKMVTLDGESRELSPGMLVIADAENPVALAGIMGGHDSEVTEKTVNIFLESAYFNPVSIRKTARAFSLMTEASQRFQRGADPEMVHYAINRAAALMQKLAGGTIVEGILDEYPQPFNFPKITLRYKRTIQVLGENISPEKQQNYLQALGFKKEKETAEQADFRVPSWRPDCKLEEDLIEEIARLYGYNNFASVPPSVAPAQSVIYPEARKIQALRHFLSALGLTEIMSMTFSNPDEVKQSGLESTPYPYRNLVMLQNPITERFTGMRTTLIPRMLQTISTNIHRGRSDLAIFEVGPVFFQNEKEAELPTQSLNLAIALSGKAGNHHWSTKPRDIDFYDLKGIFEETAKFFNTEMSLDSSDDFSSLFLPGQSTQIKKNGGEVIGILGTVSPEVCKNFDVEQEIYLFEIQLDSLIKIPDTPVQFKPIPIYPPSLRDLAIVVDDSISAESLLGTIRKYGGKLLKKVDIFDIYKGKQIPDNKKSIAFNLIFQSETRTLREKDTERAIKSILKALEKEYGATLR